MVGRDMAAARKAGARSQRTRAREFALQALYQTLVGRNPVAEIDAFLRDQGGGFPFFAVDAGEDADFAVEAGDVGAAFAEDAEPGVVVADQIGEGVVGGGVPDLAAIEEAETAGVQTVGGR